MIKKLTQLGVLAVAIGAVGAAAAAIIVWQAFVWLDASRADDQRADALHTAEAQVVDLTSMDSDNVSQKLKALGERLSGDFKRQFDGFSSAFADAVKEGRIAASGEIRGSAITEYDDDSAKVIVASSAEVTAGKKQPVQRQWRFLVTLDRSDDSWLISGMEFVQ